MQRAKEKQEKGKEEEASKDVSYVDKKDTGRTSAQTIQTQKARAKTRSGGKVEVRQDSKEPASYVAR